MTSFSRQLKGAFNALVPLDTNLTHQKNVRSREIGIVVIDVHPFPQLTSKRHMSTESSGRSIGAKEHRTLISPCGPAPVGGRFFTLKSDGG
jgi:hypothetical protein